MGDYDDAFDDYGDDDYGEDYADCDDLNNYDEGIDEENNGMDEEEGEDNVKVGMKRTSKVGMDSLIEDDLAE